VRGQTGNTSSSESVEVLVPGRPKLEVKTFVFCVGARCWSEYETLFSFCGL